MPQAALRATLGYLLLWSMAGCTVPTLEELEALSPRACDGEHPCLAGYSCVQGRCVRGQGDAGLPEDGGTQEDAGTDGGTDGGTLPLECTPACAPYEACVQEEGSTRCTARYSGLEWRSPDAGTLVGLAGVSAQARLVPVPGVPESPPAALSFSATPAAGGAAQGTWTGAQADAGTYSVRWQPSLLGPQGDYLLEATWPAEGGPRAQLRVKVDTLPPVLRLVVPPPPQPPAANGFTFVDPARAAWRRDQVVQVRVESDSADLDPSSLTVSVRLASQSALSGLRPVQSPSCDTAWCGTVDVQLWQPELRAFRGNFTVEVWGRDLAGNLGVASASLPVTRWKWAFEGNVGPLRTAPALGAGGTVYVGGSNTNGKVFALRPEGSVLWEAPLGAATSSPVVGASVNGSEPVYMALADGSTTRLYVLDGASGSVGLRCPSGEGTYAGTLPVALGLTQASDGTRPVELAVAVVSGQAGLVASVDGQSACVASPLNVSLASGAALAVRGLNVFAGSTADGKVRALTVSTSSGELVDRPGYNVPVGVAAPVGLALSEEQWVVGSGSQLDGQGESGVFGFPESGSGSSWRFPSQASSYSQAGHLVVGDDDSVFFGRWQPTGSSLLLYLRVRDNSPRDTESVSGAVQGAPVLGRGGWLYTATAGTSAGSAGSDIVAWEADDLRHRWSLTGVAGRVEGSLALDCARSASGTPLSVPHGVLYVPSTDGKLYALVVDSAGLDKQAPWPKFQRDVRNTGSPATPLTDCP